MTAPANPVDAGLQVSPDTVANLWNESVGWLASHYLQILIAGGIAAALVAAMLGIRMLGRRLCRTNRLAGHWPVTVGRVFDATRLWFMVCFAAKLVAGYASPPPLVNETITVAFTIAAALQGAFWVRELVLSIIEFRAGGHEGSGLGSAISIIRLLVTITLFTIAIVLILDNLNVDVTGLVAGLGIGGIAIGLAAKGIFDDLFSALSIIFDKPFQRGNSITWDQTSGTVEAIGLKSTRVRATTGEEVVISNTNLLGKELHNMARLARRRIVLTVGIAYYTPADLCARVPEIVRQVVEANDKCTLVRCGLVNFGDSSLDYEIQFDVHSEIYDEVFGARHEVSVGLIQAFARVGIDFAFPTQVTVNGDATGRPIDDPTDDAAGAAAPDAPAPGTAPPPHASATSAEIAPE